MLLEDFESPDSPLWAFAADDAERPARTRGTASSRRAFGVLVCRRGGVAGDDAAIRGGGRPAEPRSGRRSGTRRRPGSTARTSSSRSFSESQFDEALAIARRGGFHTILIDQGSWCRSTGHYEINRDQLPRRPGRIEADGSRASRTPGFRVGLHFLGRVDLSARRVPDARAGSAAGQGGDRQRWPPTSMPQADFIPTDRGPGRFPRRGRRLHGRRDGAADRRRADPVRPSGRSQAPFGFTECRRGHLGTKRGGASQRATPSRTWSARTATTCSTWTRRCWTKSPRNFARVANACEIDMIYFDGSERLQGDHWYYNARLHKAFYDKLKNKDMLLQASSFSHYSWHLLARSASADGHGDLKGYLDERSPWFDSFGRDRHAAGHRLVLRLRPDRARPTCSSTSSGRRSATTRRCRSRSPSAPPRQASVHRRDPRPDPPLRTAAAVRPRAAGDAGAAADRPALGGEKTPEERAKLLDQRRDYRLLGDEGTEVLPTRRLRAVARDHDRRRSRRPAGRSRSRRARRASASRSTPWPGPWLQSGPGLSRQPTPSCWSRSTTWPRTRASRPQRRDVQLIESGRRRLRVRPA